jgi:hypothetical protein
MLQGMPQGFGGFGGMGMDLQNPMMQSILNNPQMLRQILNMHPGIRQVRRAEQHFQLQKQ